MKVYSENIYDTIGLYIHLPFCKSKCYYCDFNSYANEESMIEPYLRALKKEIDKVGEKLSNYEITTVFIGGGTPSLIDEKYIDSLLGTCRQCFNIYEEAEISIETNPGTLSYDKLARYRDAGINRLSIGLQAWQDMLLKDIGRIHCKDQFVENFYLAKKAGFSNINVDLIFALPNQTLEDWEETINNVAALEPTHISCYSLKIEEGTVFGSMLEEGKLATADEELDRQMYYYAIEKLSEYGFRHYEISNFAKPGFLCKHNLVYWETRGYIGLGAGAHSFFENERYNNIYDFREYISLMERGDLPVESISKISIDEQISDYMILGLRLINGINIESFKKRFGKDVFNLFGKQIRKLIERELLQFDEGSLRLTRKGLDLANQVFVEFV